MRWLIYNILFFTTYLAMLPYFLFRMARRGGYRNRFHERFGRYGPEILARLTAPGTPFFWIHAVSVGEVYVAGQMMRALREKDPAARFVFSSTSSTGFREAEKQAGPADVVIYCPLDFPRLVKRALDTIRPRGLLLTESEIWPNLLRACHRRNIPVFLVNARVSDRSAPRYRLARYWFGPCFRMMTWIMAQSDLDKQRLVDAGADPQTIDVLGSVKFDVARREPQKEAALAAFLRGCDALGDDRLLLCGGSTWPGEDEILLDIYTALRPRFPALRLAIVPRHFEKADAVEAHILSRGLACLRKTRLNSQPPAETPRDGGSVVLADTTGELMAMYALSDIVFVGRSLCEHGGQNMIEPCLCGVATIVGPHTENFRPVMSDLLAHDGLIQVNDAAGLHAAVERLVAGPDLRHALGQRGRAAVERRQGVVSLCADGILQRAGAVCHA